MKRNQRTISPHEPGQPITGVDEAIRDSEVMLRIWKKKEQRTQKALKQLQKEGMTVLGNTSSGRGHRRRKVVGK